MITDCAVCHVPERESNSIYRLLPAQSVALAFAFDDTVPEEERTAWPGLLEEALAMSPILVLPEPGPDTPLVTVSIGLIVGAGRGDNGAGFFAARGRAGFTLHRARVEVEGAPGVAEERAAAIRKAMKALAAKVELVLTW